MKEMLWFGAQRIWFRPNDLVFVHKKCSPNHSQSTEVIVWKVAMPRKVMPLLYSWLPFKFYLSKLLIILLTWYFFSSPYCSSGIQCRAIVLSRMKNTVPLKFSLFFDWAIFQTQMCTKSKYFIRSSYRKFSWILLQKSLPTWNRSK